jgi:hypothetical protein
MLAPFPLLAVVGIFGGLTTVAVIGWQNVATYILIATAITGLGAVGAARSWRSNSEANKDAVARLRADFTEFEAKQQVLRHELKAEVKSAHYALEELRKIRDPTEVLQRVLAKLDTTVGTVAEILQRSEERAAARDQAIIATQREIAVSQQLIVDRLERLADRITGQVVDKVAEVVQDQLQKE